MKIRLFLTLSVLLALAGIHTPAISDDTEIYLNPNSSDFGEPPFQVVPINIGGQDCGFGLLLSAVPSSL